MEFAVTFADAVLFVADAQGSPRLLLAALVVVESSVASDATDATVAEDLVAIAPLVSAEVVAPSDAAALVCLDLCAS